MNAQAALTLAAPLVAGVTLAPTGPVVSIDPATGAADVAYVARELPARRAGWETCVDESDYVCLRRVDPPVTVLLVWSARVAS